MGLPARPDLNLKQKLRLVVVRSFACRLEALGLPLRQMNEARNGC